MITMMIVGLVLLVLGLLLHVGILWTLGIIVLVIGLSTQHILRRREERLLG
jgi:protein-S-isoprenylcysteine O-methyltransferase Ste14